MFRIPCLNKSDFSINFVMINTYIIYNLPAENLSAETTVLVTNSEQHFSWCDYGLSLYILENSLPISLHQSSIHITASIMGDYQLPHDTHLVSAVFSIECVPKCHFSQPLVLEIEHCAKQENVQDLYFLSDDSWDNNGIFRMIYRGSHFNCGHFPHQSSYGFIELNDFCRIGVGQKHSNKREYCANVYYSGEDTTYGIHFVVTWNTIAHRKVILIETLI